MKQSAISGSNIYKGFKIKQSNHAMRSRTDNPFRTSVMIPIREKSFFMCVDAKDHGGPGTVMIYIRGTYQSQNLPIPQL